MTRIEEIEQAVARLPEEQLREFCDWSDSFLADACDRQLESDVAAGRLDTLGDQAVEDARSGRCTEL